MDTVSDAGLIRPEEAGRTVLATGPRAVPARFDPETNRIAVELTDGCGYAFPAALVQICAAPALNSFPGCWSMDMGSI